MNEKTFCGTFLDFAPVEVVAYIFRDVICFPDSWRVIIDTPDGMELQEEFWDTEQEAIAFAIGFAAQEED